MYTVRHMADDAHVTLHPPSGRVPPCDIDAERSVLGAMMLDGDTVAEVLGEISSEDFYRPAHARAFDAMLNLYERSEPIDEVTVAAQLTSVGQLESVGGATWLASLADSVPTAANAVYYARIVCSRAMARRLIRAATAIATSGYDASGDIGALLDDAEAKIFAITSSRNQKNFVPVKEIVKDAFRLIEKAYQQKETITGLPTGYVDFDEKTSGLQASDLIIVAGRPSMGKTSFALNLALNAATLTSKSVAVFSLEMSKEQLVMRMLCSEARIDSQRMRRGLLQGDEWAKLSLAASTITQSRVFIDDTGSISILEMRAKARRLQASSGLGLIVVDYMQLMRGRNQDSHGNREREISEISRGLKALAKELAVPVVALSQLNRSLESRENKRPMLSDLRESGAIEQDADVICFVYRDEYYHPDSDDKAVAEIIIGKQRNGPTNTVKLKFSREHTRFDNLVVR